MKKRIFVFLLLFSCLFLVFSEEQNLQKTLSKVSKLTHKQVRDVDKNHRINCVDYAVIFKYVWDTNTEKGKSFNCQIIRNKNPENGFHHLFIRVRVNSKSEWIYIEPQAKYPNLDMTKYWGTRYDPKYNIYNETYIWKSYL